MAERLTGTDALVARLLAGEGRQIVALVGAPGAGKSHVAEQLLAGLNAARPGCAAVLPMDGFHYDDGLLRALGRHARKGAPDTFDVGGLAATLRRLRARDETAVAVPVFDRDLEISRGSARLIGREVEVILTEGNYLLLDESPWDGLAGLFDLTVRIDVSEPELARRLRARWEGYGLDEAAIRRKLDEVDLPNGRKVLAASRQPDLVLAN